MKGPEVAGRSVYRRDGNIAEGVAGMRRPDDEVRFEFVPGSLWLDLLEHVDAHRAVPGLTVMDRAFGDFASDGR